MDPTQIFDFFASPAGFFVLFIVLFVAAMVGRTRMMKKRRAAFQQLAMQLGMSYEQKAVAFVHGFVGAGKPVGAICHGPWLLVEANVVRGRTVTSFPSIRTDLVNAGAKWVDEEVVVDQGLVTSRRPSDLPAFCAKVIEEIAEGRHEGMRRSA